MKRHYYRYVGTVHKSSIATIIVEANGYKIKLLTEEEAILKYITCNEVWKRWKPIKEDISMMIF